MEAGPPNLVETIVGLLIPPASREHVLGDLRERYISTPQYIGDAMRVVPAVIVSRVRRTSDWLLVALQAYTLFLVFRPQRFAYSMAPNLRLVLPIAAALIALALRDAYANPERPSPRDTDDAFNTALKQSLGAAVLAMAAACVPQALLSFFNVGAAWRLPQSAFVTGVFGGFLMLLPIRVAWEMLFRFGDYRRITAHGIVRDAMTPDAYRAALVKRRDTLRKSWLWYVVYFAAMNFVSLLFKYPRLAWPLIVGTAVTTLAIMLLRSLANRMADRLQRDIDDLG